MRSFLSAAFFATIFASASASGLLDNYEDEGRQLNIFVESTCKSYARKYVEKDIKLLEKCMETGLLTEEGDCSKRCIKYFHNEPHNKYRNPFSPIVLRCKAC